MTISAGELARRLRAARGASRLRQKDVAERLDLSRSSVAQIEAGRRSVSGLELERLAHLYGRDLRDFFAESFSENDAASAFFRQHPDLASDEPAADALRAGLALGRAMTGLERLLDLDRDALSVAEYSLPRPNGKWEAVRQGEGVAEQERRRLGLSDHPLPDLVELLELQGVRAANRHLPDGVSGLTLVDPSVGVLVLVNASESRNKRRFSYAHEYAHVLLDRNRQSLLSRVEDREKLSEVRANAFAASFLMPPGGVRRFVRGLAKGLSSRERVELFEEFGAQTSRAEGRPQPGSQAVQIYDAALVAHHFGVSRTAALYRLHNLDFIGRDALTRLLTEERRGVGRRVADLLGLVEPDGVRAELDFRWRFLSLGIEALRREKISRRRLREFAGLMEFDANELDRTLAAVGLDQAPAEALGSPF